MLFSSIISAHNLQIDMFEFAANCLKKEYEYIIFNRKGNERDFRIYRSTGRIIFQSMFML